MTTDSDSTGTFSAVEMEAMRARAEEVRAEKAAGRGAKRRAADEKKLLGAIDSMPPPDQELARRIHEIVTVVAPELDPKTHYGMPAWAQAGKVLCFLQVPSKYQSRYATLGFEDVAAFDDEPMWPTAFAITEIDEAVADRVAELVRRAVG